MQRAAAFESRACGSTRSSRRSSRCCSRAGSTSCSTARRAAARRCSRDPSPTPSGWSSCSSTAARSSRPPTSSRRSRCARPRRGQPVTDFVKTEVLVALEEPRTRAPSGATSSFLDELNRCQESARNALMPALDATRRVYPPHRESLPRHSRQRAVHRRRQPRQRVLRHVRHRRRSARPVRPAADDLSAARRKK